MPRLNCAARAQVHCQNGSGLQSCRCIHSCPCRPAWRLPWGPSLWWGPRGSSSPPAPSPTIWSRPWFSKQKRWRKNQHNFTIFCNKKLKLELMFCKANMTCLEVILWWWSECKNYLLDILGSPNAPFSCAKFGSHDVLPFGSVSRSKIVLTMKLMLWNFGPHLGLIEANHLTFPILIFLCYYDNFFALYSTVHKLQCEQCHRVSRKMVHTAAGFS